MSRQNGDALTRQVLEYKLDESVGFMVTVTDRRLKALLKECLAVEGVMYGTWLFLRVLLEEDGLTQKELSDRVGMMQPTTVTALRAMERHGYVHIQEDREDKRRIRIFLADKGRRAAARVLPMLKSLNEFALQGVTAEEFETLRRVLRKVRHNIDTNEFVPAKPRRRVRGASRT